MGPRAGKVKKANDLSAGLLVLVRLLACEAAREAFADLAAHPTDSDGVKLTTDSQEKKQ